MKKLNMVLFGSVALLTLTGAAMADSALHLKCRTVDSEPSANFTLTGAQVEGTLEGPNTYRAKFYYTKNGQTYSSAGFSNVDFFDNKSFDGEWSGTHALVSLKYAGQSIPFDMKPMYHGTLELQGYNFVIECLKDNTADELSY